MHTVKIDMNELFGTTLINQEIREIGKRIGKEMLQNGRVPVEYLILEQKGTKVATCRFILYNNERGVHIISAPSAKYETVLRPHLYVQLT